MTGTRAADEVTGGPGATPAPATAAGGPPGSIGRAATTVTAWNLVSRMTGFVRVIATASALGIAALGDTYQRTNQVSNVLFELLAGGMLFSVLVPSFVAVLHQDRPDEARQLASALATRALAAMAAVVAVGLVAGEPIIRALSAGADPASRQAQVDLGVFLLWFVLPQLLLYTVGSVASALLQADHRFVATSIAPACNNAVVAATMIAFAMVHDPARGLALTSGEKLLLGGGTLAGTVAMTALPLVALRRAGLGIEPRWRVPEADLRSLARRGLWGAGHVGLNEVLILATVVFAGSVTGGVIAYQTAFTFFLLPHALLAHPIFTTLYPRLSRRGAAGEHAAFAQDLSLGLRSMLFLLIPVTGLLAVAAAPALSLLHLGQLDDRGTRLVALVLAAYLAGLAGYSAFFLLTRASYALGDARRPTLVNLGATVANVAAMAVAAVRLEGTALLLAFGLINAATATGASVVLFRAITRSIATPAPVLATVGRCALAAVPAVAFAFAAAAAIGWRSSTSAVAAAMTTAVVGPVTYLILSSMLRSEELDLFRSRAIHLLARGGS